MPEIIYKKIAGGGRLKRSRFATISLWQGPDHLLQIERDHYHEQYKRFYFADIESITLCRNARRRNYNIFFGIMLALTSLGFAAPIAGFRIFTAVVWGLFFIAMVVNSLRGSTCVCYLSTAVQKEEIPALRRVRKSERIVAKLRESIAAAQGLLSPTDLQARLGVLSPATASTETLPRDSAAG